MHKQQIHILPLDSFPAAAILEVGFSQCILCISMQASYQFSHIVYMQFGGATITRVVVHLFHHLGSR